MSSMQLIQPARLQALLLLLFLMLALPLVALGRSRSPGDNAHYAALLVGVPGEDLCADSGPAHIVFLPSLIRQQRNNL